MHRPATEMCWKGEKHPQKTGAAVPRRGWWTRWQAEGGNSHTPVRGCNWDQCAPPAPLQPPVVNPLGFKEKCPYRLYKSGTRGCRHHFPHLPPRPSMPASSCSSTTPTVPPQKPAWGQQHPAGAGKQPETEAGRESLWEESERSCRVSPSRSHQG